MSAVLFGIGAGILVFLGAAHAVFTSQSSPTGGPMMPTNPDTLAAMQTRGGLGLAPGLQESLFRAWIGFNLSHALGVVIAGGFLLYHAIVDLPAAVDQPWFLGFALVVPLLYLALAMNFWFDKPRNAIAIATVLLWAGVLVEVL